MHLRVLAAMLVVSAFAAAQQPAVAVAPRVLTVCIVDAAQNAAADAEFQRSFASHIGDHAAVASGERTQINAQHVSGRDAASRLKSGACDAVLVVGPDRPRALQRIAAVAFAGALGWQRNCTKVYLVVSSRGDAGMRESLAQGFRAAIEAEMQPERRVALR